MLTEPTRTHSTNSTNSTTGSEGAWVQSLSVVSGAQGPHGKAKFTRRQEGRGGGGGIPASFGVNGWEAACDVDTTAAASARVRLGAFYLIRAAAAPPQLWPQHY